jgi:two-component system sensor histidine kinase TctE
LFGQVTQAMDTQRTLISNAAHQLRNPIAGILAMAEAVRMAPGAADARQRAEELVRSAQHASDLANRLLTLERVQSEIAPLDLSQVDVGAVFRDVLKAHAAEADARGISLRASVDGSLPTVKADRMLLREALTNLVDNALVHGGPDLHEVEMAAEVVADRLQLSVRDDGRGIAPDQHETVLARFGQAEPGPGSGLGLSIAEAVAERHGGALSLPFRDGGLTVVLDLPLALQRPTA